MDERTQRERAEEPPENRPGDADAEEPPENRPDEPGAEGGADSPSADKLPGAPAKDDAPLGDTDQHSKA